MDGDAIIKVHTEQFKTKTGRIQEKAANAVRRALSDEEILHWQACDRQNEQNKDALVLFVLLKHFGFTKEKIEEFFSLVLHECQNVAGANSWGTPIEPIQTMQEEYHVDIQELWKRNGLL